MEKILIIAESFPSKKRPNYNGGVEVVVENLIEKFSADRKVFLLTQRNAKNDEELLSPAKITRVGKVLQRTSPSFSRIVEFIFLEREILSHALRIKPDKIVATNHTNYLTGYFLSKIVKAKLILYWQDVLGFSWVRYFGIVGIFGLLSETLSRILPAENWAISQTTKNKLGRSAVFVVPPVVFKKVDSLKGKPTIQKIHGQILMVSRLVNYKRVALGIRIFSEVVKKKTQSHLMIVGDGPKKKAVEKLVKKLRLENSVTLKSVVTQEELANLYRKSEIFLHLSKIEGYCLVIQEAAGFGCKIVASYLPVLEETTKNLNGVLLIKSDTDIPSILIKIL